MLEMMSTSWDLAGEATNGDGVHDERSWWKRHLETAGWECVADMYDPWVPLWMNPWTALSSTSQMASPLDAATASWLKS